MKINYKHNYFNRDLDITNLSAKALENKSVFFESISIQRELFTKIVKYYSDNDLFWKIEKRSGKDIYHGINFSITESYVNHISPINPDIRPLKIVSSRMSSFAINQHVSLNAPFDCNGIEASEVESKKINDLLNLEGGYLGFYRLISGIMRKYPDKIDHISVWEKYIYYSYYKEHHFREEYDLAAFIRNDKGLEEEKDDEEIGADLYDIFSDSSGHDAYVGDGMSVTRGGSLYND